MRFCTRCGERLPECAAFCPVCGCRLGSGEVLLLQAGDATFSTCATLQKVGPPPKPGGRALVSSRLLSPQGRIGRVDYLLIPICSILVFFSSLFVVAWIIEVTRNSADLAGPWVDSLSGNSVSEREYTFWMVLFLIWVVVSYVIWMIAAVKRLHDIGMTGWLLMALLVPVIGSFVPLVLLVIPGNAGANQYGGPDSGTPFPVLHR